MENWVYRKFAADLVNARGGLKEIRVLGSDRATEMFKGFQFHIPNLKHVIRHKHFKDNVETYLGNYILQNAQNTRNVQNNNCPLLRCGGKTPETNKCIINERYTSLFYSYLPTYPRNEYLHAF